MRRMRGVCRCRGGRGCAVCGASGGAADADGAHVRGRPVPPPVGRKLHLRARRRAVGGAERERAGGRRAHAACGEGFSGAG